MNRHEIWRRVDHDFTQLQSKAPDGFEPVVEVYIAGREMPIEIGYVETHSWLEFVRVEPSVVGDLEIWDYDEGVRLDVDPEKIRAATAV